MIFQIFSLIFAACVASLLPAGHAWPFSKNTAVDQAAIWITPTLNPKFVQDFNLYFYFPKNSTKVALQLKSPKEFLADHKFYLERPFYWFDKKLVGKKPDAHVDIVTAATVPSVSPQHVLRELKPGQFELSQISLISGHVSPHESAPVQASLLDALRARVNDPEEHSVFRLRLNVHNSFHYFFNRKIRVIIKEKSFPFNKKIAISPAILPKSLKGPTDVMEDVGQKFTSSVHSMRECQEFYNDAREAVCKVFKKNSKKPASGAHATSDQI